MEKILLLKSPVVEKIWGGNKLVKDYGIKDDRNNLGELWAISGHKNGESVIFNSKYEGKKISEIYKNNEEVFGNKDTKKEFPLLVKILDAKENLSIQVHPDNEYGLRVENEYGKAECWYILDCNNDSDIVMGHNASNKKEVEEMINNKKWNDFLTVKDIKKDDFYYIKPGTVHAIRSNTLIYELQQSSDTTYRLYDYDRLENGKLRELHIDKSIDVITSPQNVELIKGDKLNENTTLLIENEYFRLIKKEIKNEEIIMNDKEYLLCTVIEGKAKIEDININKGDNFIVPKYTKEINIKGNATIMIASE